MSGHGGGSHDYDEDDKDMQGSGGQNSKFKEFDCPDCSANNPVDETFGDGDEVRCNYCGCEYKARVSDEGRLKLREL